MKSCRSYVIFARVGRTYAALELTLMQVRGRRNKTHYRQTCIHLLFVIMNVGAHTHTQ